MRRFLALVLVAGAAGCSQGDEGFEQAELERLVLQPADLPDVFERFDEGAQAGADTPGGQRADPSRFGRTAGWKARYRRSGTLDTEGPIVVESRADLFEDAAGAERELAAIAEDVATSRGADILPPPEDLGDDAIASSLREASLPDALFLTVAWRYRNVTGLVTANGFVDGLELADVVSLARKQQRRLAARGS